MDRRNKLRDCGRPPRQDLLHVIPPASDMEVLCQPGARIRPKPPPMVDFTPKQTRPGGNLNGDVNPFLSAERGSIEPGTSNKTSTRFRIDRHSEYSRRKGTPTGAGMAVGTRLVTSGCPPGASLQGLERGQAVLNTRPRLGRRLEACSWRRNVAPSPAPPMQTWSKPKNGPAFCV